MFQEVKKTLQSYVLKWLCKLKYLATYKPFLFYLITAWTTTTYLNKATHDHKKMNISELSKQKTWEKKRERKKKKKKQKEKKTGTF